VNTIRIDSDSTTPAQPSGIDLENLHAHIDHMEIQLTSTDPRPPPPPLQPVENQDQARFIQARATIQNAAPHLNRLLQIFTTLAIALSLASNFDYILSNPFGDPDLLITVQEALTLFLNLLRSNSRYATIGKFKFTVLYITDATQP